MHFDQRLFIVLFLSFIAATIIGTLSHEVGHYTAAKFLGFDAVIHYGYTGISRSETQTAGIPSDSFWIAAGGPIQTMLTGTIGFLLLFLKRRTFAGVTKLVVWQWLLIFMSLFWLRQAANLATGIVGFIMNGSFGRSDEVKLANHLGWPPWSIETLTAFISLIVLSIVVFKFIPRGQRLTFLTAGLVGGVVGYILWLEVIGKILLP